MIGLKIFDGNLFELTHLLFKVKYNWQIYSICKFLSQQAFTHFLLHLHFSKFSKLNLWSLKNIIECSSLDFFRKFYARHVKLPMCGNCLISTKVAFSSRSFRTIIFIVGHWPMITLIVHLAFNKYLVLILIVMSVSLIWKK